ncbi:MAG: dehypoxanthine futalosine cyclase, partial [Planctomycetaceae bacterium]
MSLDETLLRSIAGERMAPDEGLSLLQGQDLLALGAAADSVTRRLHPEPYRTYNIDRNINYSNACTAVCDFCAFYRPVDHPEAYVLKAAQLYEKIAETAELDRKSTR